MQSPDWSAADAWKTDMTLDALGRPSAYHHALSSGTSLDETLAYQSYGNMLPTTITRGQGGAAASTATFEYDDFGGLVTAVNANQGTTRFEYDAAGNPVKLRLGAGTGSVRTDVTTFDSLGRVTYVDRDTEHPVNCASAPAGTLIYDEERLYDTCPDAPAGFTCANTIGTLATSRAVAECQSSTTVRNGRWYSYDGVGRPTCVAIATKTGATIATPVTITKTYTAGSRLAQVSTSIGVATAVTYDTLGRISTMTSPGGGTFGGNENLATGFDYEPFGPLVCTAQGVRRDNDERTRHGARGSLGDHEPPVHAREPSNTA